MEHKQHATVRIQPATSNILYVASIALALSLVASSLAAAAANNQVVGAEGPIGGPTANNQFGDGGTELQRQWASSLLRLRREAVSAQRQLADERDFMKRQLPDLIAQARNDKTAERALLKLLINASLRAGLSDLGAPRQQVSALPGRVIAQQQLDDQLAEQLAEQQQQYGPGVDGARLARLEASLDQLSGAPEAVGGYPLLGFSLGQQVDKREYSKPCSFNAISCVRTPFRKL